MSKTKSNSVIEKERQLIVSVFSTEQGKELLASLAQQYVWSPQFTNDPYKLAARIGVQELVTMFCNVVEEAKGNG